MIHMLQKAEAYAAGPVPPTFRPYVPRRWRVPHTHYDPRMLWLHGQAMAELTTEKRNAELNSDQSVVLGMTIGAALIEKRVPTYFVSDDLCRALVKTEPPPDMTLKELPWAHDAILFSLPRQFCLDMIGVHIPILACARVESRVYTIPRPNQRPHEILGPNELRYAMWMMVYEANGDLLGDYTH